MHVNLYATVLNVNLLRLFCGFNSSLGFNLNFEIETAHKLGMSFHSMISYRQYPESYRHIQTFD